MRFPLKKICNKRSIRKDGLCNIYIQYCYSAKKRTLLKTGMSIPPEYWDIKKSEVFQHIPAKFGNASELNEALFSVFRKVEDLLSKRKIHT